MWEEGIVRKFGINMYTLLYLKCITNKYLLYSTNHLSNNLSERLCETALILEGKNYCISLSIIHMRVCNRCALLDGRDGCDVVNQLYSKK